MINPIVTAAAHLLQGFGYRIPSIYRPFKDAGAHRLGLALDVAHMHYGFGNYTAREAEKLARLLRKSFPGSEWIVVAEDDHIHAELSDATRFGRKNKNNNYQLEITNMDNPRRELSLSTWDRGVYNAETGEPLNAAQAGVLGSSIQKATHPGVDKLVHDLNNPGVPGANERIQVAAAQAPDMLATAQQKAAVRAMTQSSVAYVYVANGQEIANSIGNGKIMRQDALIAASNQIQSGMPAFEPRVFPFRIGGPLAADEHDFHPSFYLDAANGGPLNAGDGYVWCSSHIVVTAAALNANAGQPFTIRLQFGGPLMGKNEQSLIIQRGDSNKDTHVNLVHAVLSSGDARVQFLHLDVGGGQAPGVDFPRVLIQGLDATIYRVYYRFTIPGDYPTDRLSRYMAG